MKDTQYIERWKRRVSRAEALIYWIGNFGSAGIIYLAIPHVESLWASSPWFIFVIYPFLSLVIGSWYAVVFILFMGHEQIVYERDVEYGIDPDVYKKQTLTLAALIFWFLGFVMFFLPLLFFSVARRIF